MNKKEIKRLVICNDDFRMEYKQVIRRIADLYAYQARTSAYTMSPERVIGRREQEKETLLGVIKNLLWLNRKFGRKIFGFIKNADRIKTQWDLVDEFYEAAIELMKDKEFETSIRL